MNLHKIAIIFQIAIYIKRKCRKFIIFILVLYYITLKDEHVTAHPLKNRSFLAVYMVTL